MPSSRSSPPSSCVADEQVQLLAGSAFWVSTAGEVGSFAGDPVTVPGFNRHPDPGDPDACEPHPWYVRIERDEGSAMAKVWPAVEPEPEDWSLVAPDLGYGQHQLVLATRAWNDWGPTDVFVLEAIDIVPYEGRLAWAGEGSR